jgi:hypothetical protein
VGPKGPVSLPVAGDGMTMFRMPSSIGWLEGQRIDLDAFLYRSVGRVRNSLNRHTLDASTPAGNIGAAFNVRQLLGVDDDDRPSRDEVGVFFGIGEYVHLAGGGTPAKLYSTTFPEGKKTTVGLTFLTTALNVAVRPVEWLSLGAGFHFTYATVTIETLIGGSSTTLNGSPQVLGVPLPGNPTYADFLKIFASDQATDPTTFVQADLRSFQLGGTASVSLSPLDQLGLGFAYAPQSYAMDFEGAARVDATRTFDAALGGLSPGVKSLFLGTLPNGGGQGFIGKYDMKLSGLRVPQNVRANVAVWPIDRVLVAFEVAWYEWHRAVRAKTHLTGGSNRDLNHVIGSDEVQSTIKFNWHNQWVFSVQTAVLAIEDLLVIRGGLNYGKSPINANYIGNGPNSGLVDWNASLGAGVFLGPVEISILAEHGFHNHAHAPRSEALTTKNGYYSSQQFFLHLGASVKF